MIATKKSLFSWPLLRYFSREIVPIFLLGTFVFLTIVVSFQALRLADLLISRGIPLFGVAKLALHSYHSLLTVAVPIAFLFAVMWGTSRANLDGEIVGMQVSGISLKQLYFPTFLFSLLLTAFCIYASHFSVPEGNKRFELMVTQLGARTAIQNLKPKVFQEGFFGMVLYAEEVSRVSEEMKRVFIYDERDPKNPYAITAQSAALRKDERRSRITLRLADGSIHVDKKSHQEQQQKIDFDIYDINLVFNTGANTRRPYYMIPSLTYPELVGNIRKVEKPSKAHRLYLVEYHRRFSMAVCCIIFGAMGFFMSISSKRSMGSSSIVFCLMIGVVYWLSYVLANAAAINGWIVPWIGVWLPSVLFALVPIHYYRKHPGS